MSEIETKKMALDNQGENNGAFVGINPGTIVVHNGMEYSDVRSLCQDLISGELAKYHSIALDVAKKREEQLFDMFSVKLVKEQLTNSDALKAFEEPSMQIDCIEAQKAYMRTGTPELKDILTDILVCRVKEKEQSLLQIVLSESIQVAAMLLPSQMATLALRFVLGHTRRLNITNEVDLIEYCRKSIIPLFRKASTKTSEFQHLSFTGCGQVSLLVYSLPEIISNSYPGIFSQGFSLNDIPIFDSDITLKNKYPQFFMPCITDKSKWQINTMDEEILHEQLEAHSIPIDNQKAFEELYIKQKMSATDAQAQLEKWIPDMKDVFEYWENTNIKSLNLSSVGIVIGALYSQIITEEKYDLNIWI